MNSDFIVSLASHSKRMNTLHLCLESLFKQTIRPKKILLYLDSSVSSKDIPNNIIPFIEAGLEIIFVSNQIGPHNKYYFTLKNYPNDTIVTVDDDVIYNKVTFEKLVETHYKFPYAVCANRVNYMMFDIDGKIMPYNEWISEYSEILYPSKKLFATGVGGVLYPPHIFSKSVLNIKEIIKLALTVDDIWLKVMELENGIPVVWSGLIPQHPTQIPGTMEKSLWRTVNKFKNDEYIKNMIEYYQLDLYSLTKEDDK